MPDGWIRHTHASMSDDPTAPPQCINDQAQMIAKTFNNLDLMVTKLITKIAGEENVQWVNGTSSEPKSLYETTYKDRITVYHKEDYETDPVDPDPDHLLPFRMDNELFLLLTPFPDHPLKVKDSSGEVISASGVGGDSVLVFMTRGLNSWLLQGSPAACKFHAVPRAVPTLNQNANLTSRTVYSRKKYVPDEAIPYQRRNEKDVPTFADELDLKFGPESGFKRDCGDGNSSGANKANVLFLVFGFAVMKIIS